MYARPADLLHCDVELVLSFVGCELPEHHRRRDMARLDRGDKPQDVTPLFADHFGSDAFSEQRRDMRVGRGLADRDQPSIRKIAKPRAKPEPEHCAQGEHVIGGAAGVGIMLSDGEIGAMTGQAIEHVRRFVGPRPQNASRAYGQVRVKRHIMWTELMARRKPVFDRPRTVRFGDVVFAPAFGIAPFFSTCHNPRCGMLRKGLIDG